jgi:hypothetical protein
MEDEQLSSEILEIETPLDDDKRFSVVAALNYTTVNPVGPEDFLELSNSIYLFLTKTD